MNCADAQYLRPLYLSGELDSGSVAQFERHRDDCLSCQRQIEEDRNLDTGLRHALQSEPVDATALRARVLAEIHKTEDGKVSPWKRHPVWITAAVAAMLLVMITFGLARRDNARYEEASADHVDEVVMARPKDWQTQNGRILQLVTQRLAMPANLRQLAIPRYRLLRGKECSIAKNRYVHLVYGDGSQQISMYVLEGDEHGLLRRISTSLLPQIRSRAKAGYNVTEGDAHGRRILLVSTLPATEEQAIVKNVLQTMS
jgi:anti-sigma factor RsiW